MILALALICISTATVFARMMRDVSPVAMRFWRMAIGAGVLWMITTIQKKGFLWVDSNYSFWNRHQFKL